MVLEFPTSPVNAFNLYHENVQCRSYFFILTGNKEENVLLIISVLIHYDN